MNLSRTTETFQALKKKFEKFVYSIYYIVLINLGVIFCYATNSSLVQLIGLAFISLTVSFIFIFIRDFTPVLPLLCSVIMLFSSLSITTNFYFYIILAPALISLIIHLIKYPLTLKGGQLYAPLLCVSVALALGGIFSPYMELYSRGLAHIIALGPGLFIIYGLFRNYLTPIKNFELNRYFMLSIISATLVGCFEVVIKYIYAPPSQSVLSTSSLGVGWGSFNTVGVLILFAFPMALYLMITEKRRTPYLFTAIILFAFAFVTKCDGAILTLVAFVPLTIFFYRKRLPKKIRQITNVSLFILVMIVILLLIIFNKQIIQYVNDNVDTMIFSIKVRDELYNDAINAFTINPLFGVGFGYYNNRYMDVFAESWLEGSLYNFHSSFYHTLASMGIVGIFAYAFFYYRRLKTLAKRPCDFNVFMFYSFALFEIYALVDTAEFFIIPCMIFNTLLIVIVELENNKKKEFKLRKIKDF